MKLLGDKILCVLEGKEFKLPLFAQQVEAEDGARLVMAWQALEFPVAAHELFASTMLGKCVRQSGRYFFFEDFESLPEGVRLIHGVTPERHFVWTGAKDWYVTGNTLTITEDPEPMPEKIDEAFLRELASRTMMGNLSQTKIWWNAFVRLSLEWMLVRRKPVNLGWAIIYALPYRANWKSILAAGFPNCYSCYTRENEEKIEAALVAMGIIDAFSGKELLEVHGTEHWCNWKPEIVPTKIWERTIERTEKLRVSKGKAGYSIYLIKHVARLKAAIQHSFRYFVCRSVVPTAKILKGHLPGDQIIAPATPKGGIRPKAMAKSCGDICLPRTLDWKKPKFTDLIEEEIGQVLSLPDVQPEADDMRITGGHLERS